MDARTAVTGNLGNRRSKLCHPVEGTDDGSSEAGGAVRVEVWWAESEVSAGQPWPFACRAVATASAMAAGG